ncbi:hypothetical protein RZS08_21065, partial [Arthrospira platensis SPKY1]|nr:hypothetical protein [Arthrospira platensis SPKY1]
GLPHPIGHDAKQGAQHDDPVEYTHVTMVVSERSSLLLGIPLGKQIKQQDDDGMEDEHEGVQLFPGLEDWRLSLRGWAWLGIERFHISCLVWLGGQNRVSGRHRIAFGLQMCGRSYTVPTQALALRAAFPL